MKPFAIITPSSLISDAILEGVPQESRGDVAVWQSVSELQSRPAVVAPEAIIYDLPPGADPQEDMTALSNHALWGKVPVLIIHPPLQAQAATGLVMRFANVADSLTKPFPMEALFERLANVSIAATEEALPNTMKEADNALVQSLPGVTDAFAWSPSGSLEYASSPRAAQFNTTVSYALQIANRIGQEVEMGDFAGLQILGLEGGAAFFSVLTDRDDNTKFRTYGVLTDGSADPDAVIENLQQKLLA